jgi:hypothetical protein
MSTQGFFLDHCIEAGIKLVLVATKKQCQNYLAERTWQTVCSVAWSLLVYARLPDTFWLQALCYATHILNVLPVRGHNNEEETPSTPYELFFGQKPSILSFRVFGCPGVIQRWSADERSNGKQTERGMRGIFIGFHDNQKGFLFYMPGSHNTIITGDATFDETFHTAIATTWQQHRDTLALQPIHGYIPDVTTAMEQTGTIIDTESSVEEGELHIDSDTMENSQQTSSQDSSHAHQSHNETSDDFDDPPSSLTGLPPHNNTPIDQSPLIVDCSNNDPSVGPR